MLSTSCQGGADPAQVQALLGHASLDTSARYFRAGPAETAAVVERVFDQWTHRSTLRLGRRSGEPPSRGSLSSGAISADSIAAQGTPSRQAKDQNC